MSEDCHEEHEKIFSKLETIEASIEFHIADVHGKLVTREEIERRDDSIDEAMREALLGPIIQTGLHAGRRQRELGIEHKVDVMWRQSQNGGLRTKLAPASQAAIWSAAVGAFGVIIAALIGIL